MMKQYGMTKSETILVLAIIGTLVAVGFVIFDGTGVRENLLKAEQALVKIAREEQAYRASHGVYPPLGAHMDYLPFFGGNGTRGSGKPVIRWGYRIEIVRGGTPSSFTVRATPRPGGAMVYRAGKPGTGWLSLDDKGHKDSQAVPHAWP